jgi:hypothetical protein
MLHVHPGHGTFEYDRLSHKTRGYCRTLRGRRESSWFTLTAMASRTRSTEPTARLYERSRLPGPITSALCWAHARPQFFELADIAANTRRGKNAAAISPIALEAVRRIDALFD